jgi:hypothetical protein
MTYEPTMKLRFIERVVMPDGRTARFLQQMFEHPYTHEEDHWEDVPFVTLNAVSESAP